MPIATRQTARRTPHAGALLLAGVLALGAPVLTATSAAAHDRLESTNPADGTTVEFAPDDVVLTMSSTPLALGTQVEVTGPDGAVVSTGDARIVDNTVTQALDEARPAGGYSVAWRVTSSDGHPISGTFAFTASGGSGTITATEDLTQEPSPDPSESTTSSTAASPATIDPSNPTVDEGNRALIAVGIGAVVIVGGIGGIIGYRRRNR